MWVDGFKSEKENAKAAVCWKDRVSNSWRSAAVYLGKNKENLDAELLAIVNGLDIARKITSGTENTLVTVFSDSQEAITEIHKVNLYSSSPYLRKLIYQKNQRP